MGSAPSTPNREDQVRDLWWPIENTDLTLAMPTGVTLPNEETESLTEAVSSDVPSIEITTVAMDSSSDVTNAPDIVEIPEEAIVNRSVHTEKEQTLEEFKEELKVKRLARQNALAALRTEISDLRTQLEGEKEINRHLRSKEPAMNPPESDVVPSTPTSLRVQLAETQLSLQMANAENLKLNTELGVVRKQVASLKEVIVCSKEMIKVREDQVTQLKQKLHEIEESLAERELKIMSDDLRQEYNRQLANIRNLRQLYEERARVNAAERENLNRQISIKKDELAAENEKVNELEKRVASLEAELNTVHANLSSTKTQRDEYNSENKGLKEEMATINKLFSQMLLGFNGENNLDIDRLTSMLEENRTLLNEMATSETDHEGACLPKLLFDIVNEANDKNENAEYAASCQKLDHADPSGSGVTSAQEIIGNLPKVWRVLFELLNHQKITQVEFEENGQGEDCYKSTPTPAGTKAELSVSKTYIKLKDLILEKKALQKETTRLKTLNCHLDRRLNEQEKRLSSVSLELTKTWHLVGKMQRQHRQLHTHEQILRYQLQQKRRLLNELKDELEYCRRKWAAARAKNAESQIQCDDLRKEFANRKLQDANNSAESGYSDGPLSDEEDTDSPKRNHCELFNTSRKFERTHSQSPSRSPFKGSMKRGNSAPHIATIVTEIADITANIAERLVLQNIAASSIVSENMTNTAMVIKPPKEIQVPPISNDTTSTLIGQQSPQNSESIKTQPSSSGTIPKVAAKLSRSKREKKAKESKDCETLEEMFYRISGQPQEEVVLNAKDDDEKRNDRTVRIQRLESQCKALITQVIETSSCREQLSEQLTRFKQELEPSTSSPCSSDEPIKVSSKLDLQPEQVEDYNANRAERLRILEEESKKLLKKIKKTTDRGDHMTSRVDHLRSRCTSSRESSFDEGDSEQIIRDGTTSSMKLEATVAVEELPMKLTATEQAGIARRAERIRRLEEESKWLLDKVSKNAERGAAMNVKLEQLHTKYGNSAEQSETTAARLDACEQIPATDSAASSADLIRNDTAPSDTYKQLLEASSDNSAEGSTTEDAEVKENGTKSSNNENDK